MHPTRSVHNGWNKGHAAYNRNIQAELDAIARTGKKNKWTQQQYADAIDKLSKKYKIYSPIANEVKLILNGKNPKDSLKDLLKN